MYTGSRSNMASLALVLRLVLVQVLVPTLHMPDVGFGWIFLVHGTPEWFWFQHCDLCWFWLDISGSWNPGMVHGSNTVPDVGFSWICQISLCLMLVGYYRFLEPPNGSGSNTFPEVCMFDITGSWNPGMVHGCLH